MTRKVSCFIHYDESHFDDAQGPLKPRPDPYDILDEDLRTGNDISKPIKNCRKPLTGRILLAFV